MQSSFALFGAPQLGDQFWESLSLSKMHLSSAVTQSSACFLTLNHMDGLFAHRFSWFLFSVCFFSLHEAHDASKMKLATLAGRRLTVDPGQVELGSKKYSCVCVCVLSFPCIHTIAEKPDVLLCFIASCPRREQSHLLEGLCRWCTVTLSLYRSIHLLPALSIRLRHIKCITWWWLAPRGKWLVLSARTTGFIRNGQSRRALFW